MAKEVLIDEERLRKADELMESLELVCDDYQEGVTQFLAAYDGRGPRGSRNVCDIAEDIMISVKRLRAAHDKHQRAIKRNR